MSEIIVLQHVASEGLGTIAGVLDDRGIGYRYVRPFDGERVPAEIGDAGGLIVMGGPMGVNDQDEFPFLKDELRLIETAISRETPILGVCLGSQLLASALGASVRPGPRVEVGWYPTKLTPDATSDALWNRAPADFMGFHWHGDMYDVPSGAIPLASTDLTRCQSFRYGANAYGILFHMEVTEPMIRDWTESSLDWLASGGVDVAVMLAGIANHQADLSRVGVDVFSNWATLVATR